MSCNGTHACPASEHSGAPQPQSRAVAEKSKLNELVERARQRLMLLQQQAAQGPEEQAETDSALEQAEAQLRRAEATAERGEAELYPQGWSSGAREKYHLPERRDYAEAYAAFLERRGARPEVPVGLTPHGARAVRGHLDACANKTGAARCPKCQRFMSTAQGCKECPGTEAEQDAARQPTNTAATPAAPEPTAPAVQPATFENEKEFADWLSHNPQAFGDRAAWRSFGDTRSDKQSYMAVAFDEPQNVSETQAHVGYIMRGPLAMGNDFSSLQAADAKDGQARLFFFNADWGASLRSDFREDLEANLWPQLREGTPERKQNKQGGYGRSVHPERPRAFNPVAGKFHVAFSDGQAVDAQAVYEMCDSPAMEAAGIPASQAYAASIGDFAQFLPRCSCGRFMSPQNPICTHPVHRKRDDGLYGRLQSEKAVTWPPPGYTFKGTRVKVNGRAVRAAPEPAMPATMKMEEAAPPAATAPAAPAPELSAAKELKGHWRAGESAIPGYKQAAGQYFVAMDSPNGDVVYRPVEGHPVTVAGYEAFDLFAHPDANNPALWKISEGVSGMGVVGGYPSEAEALTAAETLLGKMTPDSLREVVKNNAEYRARQSPRYQPTNMPESPEYKALRAQLVMATINFLSDEARWPELMASAVRIGQCPTATPITRQALAYRSGALSADEFAKVLAEATGVTKCESCGRFVSQDGEGHAPTCETLTGAKAAADKAVPPVVEPEAQTIVGETEEPAAVEQADNIHGGLPEELAGEPVPFAPIPATSISAEPLKLELPSVPDEERLSDKKIKKLKTGDTVFLSNGLTGTVEQCNYVLEYARSNPRESGLSAEWVVALPDGRRVAVHSSRLYAAQKFPNEEAYRAHVLRGVAGGDEQAAQQAEALLKAGGIPDSEAETFRAALAKLQAKEIAAESEARAVAAAVEEQSGIPAAQMLAASEPEEFTAHAPEYPVCLPYLRKNESVTEWWNRASESAHANIIALANGAPGEVDFSAAELAALSERALSPVNELADDVIKARAQQPPDPDTLAVARRSLAAGLCSSNKLNRCQECGNFVSAQGTGHKPVCGGSPVKGYRRVSTGDDYYLAQGGKYVPVTDAKKIRPVAFAGHDGYDFFAHLHVTDIPPSGPERGKLGSTAEWRISNGFTGGTLSKAVTFEQAMALAEKKLGPPEEFRAKVAGLGKCSPRFEQVVEAAPSIEPEGKEESYQCGNCGHTWTARTRTEPKCPKCGNVGQRVAEAAAPSTPVAEAPAPVAAAPVEPPAPVAPAPVEPPPAPAFDVKTLRTKWKESPFQTGARVALANGRHGTITGAMVFERSEMQTVGLRGLALVKTGEELAALSVRTDNGAQMSVSVSDLEDGTDGIQLETERPAQVALDPMLDGRPRLLDECLRELRVHQRHALNERTLARRAKLKESNRKHLEKAGQYEADAANVEKVLTEWAQKNPDEARRVLSASKEENAREFMGKALPPEAAPVTAGETSAPGAAVETNPYTGNPHKARASFTTWQGNPSVELTFPQAPPESVINDMRRVGFKWSRPQRKWYAKGDPDTENMARKLTGAQKCPKCARFVSDDGKGHAPTCGQVGQAVAAPVYQKWEPEPLTPEEGYQRRVRELARPAHDAPVTLEEVAALEQEHSTWEARAAALEAIVAPRLKYATEQAGKATDLTETERAEAREHFSKQVKASAPVEAPAPAREPLPPTPVESAVNLAEIAARQYARDGGQIASTPELIQAEKELDATLQGMTEPERQAVIKASRGVAGNIVKNKVAALGASARPQAEPPAPAPVEAPAPVAKEPEAAGDDDVMKMLREMQAQLAQLEAENAQLKAQEAALDAENQG